MCFFFSPLYGCVFFTHCFLREKNSSYNPKIVFHFFPPFCISQNMVLIISYFQKNYQPVNYYYRFHYLKICANTSVSELASMVYGGVYECFLTKLFVESVVLNMANNRVCVQTDDDVELPRFFEISSQSVAYSVYSLWFGCDKWVLWFLTVSLKRISVGWMRSWTVSCWTRFE